MARLAQLMPMLIGAALQDNGKTALATQILSMNRSTLAQEDKEWLEAMAGGKDAVTRRLEAMGIQRKDKETAIAALLRAAQADSARLAVAQAVAELEHASKVLDAAGLAAWMRRKADRLEPNTKGGVA